MKRSGLGTAFMEEVEQAIQQILEFPESAPEVVSGVRKKLLHRFPYAVLYSIRGSEIRILAVANQRQQRPFYWRGRN